MSTEEPQQDVPKAPDVKPHEPPTAPAAMATTGKKRPRIDLNAAPGGGERKRGKSMFGVLVNTLNKAKAEDKERNASEAAKKRQMLEQRLQSKLKKETDSVRRAEEAKRDKVNATRKEEDLQLKDSIYKLRRTRLPLLANFLLTSDVIKDDEMEDDSTASASIQLPARSHPPPLYYLPAILTPAQEAFLDRRKAHFKEAAEKEWESFQAERKSGIEEIQTLRRKAEDEERRNKTEPAKEPETKESEAAMAADNTVAEDKEEPHDAADMEVDDNRKEEKEMEEKKDDRMEGDDDEAVEY